MSFVILDPPTGWPWPLDAVQGWFEDLWSSIQNWIDGVKRAVWDFMPDPLKNFIRLVQDLTDVIWTAILNFFRDPLGAIKSGLDVLFTGVRDLIGYWDPVQGRFVGGFLGWLWDTLGPLGAAIYSIVKPIVDAILPTISWLGGIVWGWVDGALRWATDTFRWLRNEIAGDMGWVIGEVKTYFDGAFAGIAEALKPLLDPIAGIAETFIDPLQKIIDFFLSLFVRLSGGEIRPGSPEYAWMAKREPWWEGWPAYIISDGLVGAFKRDALSGEVFTEKAKLAMFGGSPEWVEDLTKASTDYISRVRTDFVDKLIAPPAGSSPITPEEAITWGTGLVSTAIGLATAIWTAHIVAEAGSLGQLDGVNLLYNNIMSATGLSAISSSFLRVPLDAGIMAPARQFYNAAFRPRIPDTRSADEMFFKENITEAKWRDIYEKWGWKNEDIEAWQKTMYREPMQRTLLTMLEDPEIPEEWILRKLRAIGFTPQDLEIIIGYKRRLIFTKQTAEYDVEKRRLRDNKKADYVKGYITYDTLSADLIALDYPPEAVAYFVSDAESDRERKQKDLLLDLYEDAYVKDLITDDELESRAREILVVPDAIETFLARAYVRKYKKPPPPKPEKVRVATLTYLTTAYREEIISEDEFRAELLRRGFSADDIDLILTVESMKKAEISEREARKLVPPPPEEVKTATLSYLATAFRLDVISEADFRTELVRRNYAPEDIEMIIRVETLKKMKAAGE